MSITKNPITDNNSTIATYENLHIINETNAEKLIKYLDSPIIKQYNITFRGKVKNSHLTNFFFTCSLRQFELQKDIFIKNKDTPEFSSLLFTLGFLNTKRCLIFEKVKLLLEWGYNPNVEFKDSGYQYVFPDFGDDVRPINMFVNINNSIRLLLINHGADVHHKAQIYPFLKSFADCTQITKFTNIGHLQKLIDFYDKEHKKYVFHYDYDRFIYHFKQVIKHYNIKEANNMLNPYRVAYIKELNQKLQVSLEPLSIFQFFKILNKKRETEFLKKFENPQDITFQEKKEYETILNAHPENKQQLIKNAIKQKNSYFFDNIENINLTFQNSKITALHYAICFNNLKLMKKIVEDKMLDITQYDYLYYAYRYQKSKAFIYLYEKGNNKKNIDLVTNHINVQLNRLKKDNCDDLSSLPTSIIYFLLEKGYHFNNQNLIEKLAIIEKKSLLNTISPDKEYKTNNKFKI